MLVTIPPVIRYPFSAKAAIQAVPFQVADPKWEETWKSTLAGSGVKIGVIDTGIDPDHPEFDECFADAKDFTGSPKRAEDVEGHGTHVCSLISGKHCGVAPAAKIYMGKGLGDDGSGSDESVAAAGYWLIDECGVDILSMSLGSSRPSVTLEKLCAHAAAKNVLVFAASGNEGATRSGYPAGYDSYCVSVGAVDRRFNVARFSNSGASLDIANYGVEVYGAQAGGGFVAMSGTSMATPLEAGCAANALSMERKLFEVRKTLSLSDWARFNTDTIDLGATGRDDYTGNGFHVPAKIAARIQLEASAVTPDPIVSPPMSPSSGKYKMTGTFDGTLEAIG